MASTKSDRLREMREANFERLKARASVSNQKPVLPGEPKIINTSRREQLRTAQAAWRARNPELARQRAREGMRKRRANNNG